MVGSIKVQILLGDSLSPASSTLMLALRRVHVEQSDDGPILFNITFASPPAAKFNMYNPIAHDPGLQPFSRVIVIASLNGTSARVLVDGFITRQDQTPGDGARAGSFTVVGEDVSVMMSLDSTHVEHVSLDVAGIVRKILGAYTTYGITASVTAPTLQDPPTTEEQTRLQTECDRRYLVALASECGHVFYVTPGPTTGRSTAYWGPRVTSGTVQPTLSVDLGPYTNVQSLKFQYNPLDARVVNDEVLDDEGTDPEVATVSTTASSQTALSSKPAIAALGSNVRKGPVDHGGRSVARSRQLAQGTTDGSTADAVTGTGQLSVLRYGAILEARKLVGVRGAGMSYDGTYRVKSVTHDIAKGRYEQSFTLAREGLVALSTTVTT